MKISVKKYNNDISRAYKTMMRKLNADGFYTEVKKKKFFTSKSELAREERKAGISRYKKAESKRRSLMDKLEKQQSFGNKKQHKPRNHK